MKSLKEILSESNKSFKTNDGDEVKVGDHIGFKDGVEQYGRVHKIDGDNVHVKQYNSDTGDYEHRQIHKSRLWKE